MTKYLDRKISLKPIGLLLVLALAVYSLLCVYVSGATIIGFLKKGYRIIETHQSLGRNIRGYQIFRNIYLTSGENRHEFVVKYDQIFGIPKFVDGYYGNNGLYNLNLKGFGDNFQTLKVTYIAALGCFLLGSLFHCYVALRTLFQPSYTAGMRGIKVQQPPKSFETILLTIFLFLFVGCFILSMGNGP